MFADRNLLFGIVALQMDFVTRDGLVAAMSAWALEKARPLGEILVGRGDLADADRALLEQVVEAHLRRHGGEPERSLAALPVSTPVYEALRSVGDEKLKSSAAQLTVAEVTGPYPPPRDTCSSSSRYRRLRPHAKGGLGEVFVAEDAELNREVALKEIRPVYADDPGARARFLLEAEVNGRLEHPHIVPVYGLGRHENGRPYYAMRFIQGDTLRAAITRFHKADVDGRDPGERMLSLRQLLGQFVAVCYAVAYAHSQGVLHRDLKPGNVMLGKFGETLLVDWGLAKVLRRPGERAGDGDGRPLPDSGDFATQAGSVVGTPGFMSPEQASGKVDQIGPASDVYGLGAVLYVLLTGQPPFGGQDKGEIFRRTMSGDWTPAAKVKPGVPAALSAVCGKAMALRPEDRYASAAELAAEVERWLADEPVRAHSERWTARAARWGRRHRTFVMSAVVLLATATAASGVGTALVLREQARTEEQRRLAEESYQAAVGLTTEMIGIAEEALPPIRQSEAVRKRLLEAALPTFHRLNSIRRDDKDLDSHTAILNRFAGNLRRLMNEFQKAEEAYKESIRLEESLLAGAPHDIWFRDRLGQTLRDYATLQKRAGRLTEADATMARSVGLAEEVFKQVPNNARAMRDLGLSLIERAEVYQLFGKDAEAERAALRAMELFRGLLPQPEREKNRMDPVLLALALNVTAVQLRERGRTAESLAALAEAVNFLQGMLAAKDDANARHYLARTKLEQGLALQTEQGGGDQAEKAIDHSVRLWEELTNFNPLLPVYREWLGRGLEAQGRLRAARGNFAGADTAYSSAIAAVERLSQDFPEVPEYLEQFGMLLEAMATLAASRGDADQSAKWYFMATARLRKASAMVPENVRYRKLLLKVEAAMKTR